MNLTCLSADGSEAVHPAAVSNVVIAGWAGRNRAEIDAHIRELADLGVQAPSSVPLFYRTGREMLTVASNLQVLGKESSGEAEPVYIQHGDELLVAVGSDHTDRQVEAYSIAVSKQMCPKAISPRVWRFSDVADHWDKLVLRSFATIAGERVLYQEGRLDALLAPSDLFDRFAGAARLAPGTVMFGGTISVEGGIRPMDRFEISLEDPVLGRRLDHAYSVETLPVVS